MTLSELAATMPPRQKIRLGTSEGNHFVYRGMVKNCDLIKWGAREVTDAYQGIIEPDQIVIIIRGAEKGKEYNPKIPRLTTESVCDDAVYRIVGCTYRELANNLLYAYEHRRERAVVKMKRDVLEEKLKELQELLENVEAELIRLNYEDIEREIKSVPFGKGELVLNECRAIVAREEGVVL